MVYETAPRIRYATSSMNSLARIGKVRQFVAYSQPLDTDRQHHDYQHRGRLTADTIRHLLPAGQFDYYLCGPGGMMQEVIEGLLATGVPEDRILYEAFGPASIRRASKPQEQPAPSSASSLPWCGWLPAISRPLGTTTANRYWS